MASSSLLRSAARRELRRSIPCRDGLARLLLSTDSSTQRMSPSSSPNATTSLLLNIFCSDCAKRMDTTKKQFSEDDLKEFNRYLSERTKQAERNMYLCLDKSADACENRYRPLRNIKAMLEARNKRSAQKYLLVKQWAVLISYSSVFALALHNLHLFS